MDNSSAKAMGRSFLLLLPCLPSPSLLLSRSSTLPISKEKASAFDPALYEDLEKLEHSLAGAAGSVSLAWSAQAMSLIKKMHFDLLALLKTSNLPVSYGAEEDWFDQYMKETAALLDFCNSLKSAVSGITRYRMAVDLAIQRFDGAGNSSSTAASKKKELGKRESCLDRAGAMKVVREGSSRIGTGGGSDKHGKSISVVMLAAKKTMMAVTLILASAIVYPVSMEMGSGEVEFPQLRPVAAVLADMVVDDLMKAQVVGDYREGFSAGVEVLRARSARLREGAGVFDDVVDGVFEVVIRGREEMLGILRKCDLFKE